MVAARPVFHAVPFLVTAQLLTFEEDQLISVVPVFVVMRVGFALIEIIGCSTVTVAIAET